MLGNEGKIIVSSPNAPKAVGPYSQAVKIGNMIFCSGQIPLDPATGEVVGTDITAQTHRVLKNLQGLLDVTGSGLFQVVKTTVFLQNMEDFAAMNAVYSQYFTVDPPARSTIQVARLPTDVLVEVEAIAVQPQREIGPGAKSL